MILRDNEPIRVLMISPQFRPLVGGYEQAAERLSTALAEAGTRVVVITERRDRAWPAVEAINGYEVRRLPCWYRRHCHAVTSLLSFASFLLRHGRKFDVWHVHQYGFLAALAVALGKLLRRPVLLKLPSSNAMGIERAMGAGIVGRILRFFHLRVNACLAVSDETREEAIHLGIPPERIYLIPNGVDGRQFHPTLPEERAAARRALGLHCDRLVLYVGRLSPEKNPLGLLEAWAAIDTETRKGALLALVGDGPDWDQVHAKARQPNVAGNIHLAGMRSDVSTWYRAADVYVIPSLLEGLANTMIEALASGLPIISTRVSGSSILLESPIAGLVADVGNVENLARALESLLRDKSMRARLGANARLTFEARFSLETLSKKMILLYRGLLARQSRNSISRAKHVPNRSTKLRVKDAKAAKVGE
jgi:glycosyltransferase involved in cell wall biosynthesis